MDEEWDVADHFVVGILVPFGQHGDPVNDQHSTQSLGLHDSDFLVWGTRIVEDILYLYA